VSEVALGRRSRAEERRLILLSAGTEERRRAGAEEMLLLAANVDWERMINALRARHLLAALGPRLIPLAPETTDFEPAVEAATEAGRRQSAFLQLVARSAVGALADAGIAATTLKGPDLGEAIYGDPGRRFSGDVDLLVSPTDLFAAVEVIRGLGYGTPHDRVDRSGLPLLHFALVHEGGDLPPIELHWRVHWYETAFAAARLLPPDPASSPSWRPAPVDQLASLLLYYARDGFLDLRLAADLSAWWDRFGAEIPPGALGELIASHPALGPPVRAGALAAERVVGLPAASLVAGAGSARARERLAVRFADPFPRVSEKQAYAEMSLVDGLLAPPHSVGSFLQRQLVAPAERGAADGGLDADERVGGLAFVGRFLVRCGIFFRFALALASVSGRRRL
jgi:hypothetical protein